jgi:glycosyltransferase involved in cell wall biosynthesis
MRASLIITTYNWPEALDLTLASALRQSVLPAEIIVADDGSGAPTGAVVARWQARAAVPIRHVWQEDRGFRLARSRNRAIAAASNEYLVLVDGDMVLQPRFIEDHLQCARTDCFIQGARPQLSAATTARLLGSGELRIGPFTRGLARRSYAVRSRLLSRFASRVRATLAGIQGCNQSFWRHHALEVNGYDERFNAWGPEDREFAARLLHIGVHRNYVRHRAIAFHLHHVSRAPGAANPLDGLLAKTLAERATRCVHGIVGPAIVGSGDAPRTEGAADVV